MRRTWPASRPFPYLTLSGRRWRASVMRMSRTGTAALCEAIKPLLAAGEEDKRQTVLEHSRPRGLILLTKSMGGTLYLGVVGSKAHYLWREHPYGSSPVERSSAMDTPPCF
jgi:hypothetical protein